MPAGPAIGVKPCVMFAGPEWQDHSARRFGLAAPRATSSGGEARVSVQPFNDALLERLDLGLKARPAAVMLQKARTFVKARSPVFSVPIGGVDGLSSIGQLTQRQTDLLSLFSRFSRFSAVPPHQRVFGGSVVGDDRTSYRLICELGA